MLLVNPLPGYRLTDAFGRRDPVAGVPGSGGLHSGQDVAAPLGTRVRAAAAGRVSFVGWKDQFGGNMVHIDHPDGTQTRYAHLSGFLVKLGQQVEQNEDVALVGTTGASNGFHLHWEYLVNGQYVNPMNYLADPAASTNGLPMFATSWSGPTPGNTRVSGRVTTDYGSFGVPTMQIMGLLTRRHDAALKPGSPDEMFDAEHVIIDNFLNACFQSRLAGVKFDEAKYRSAIGDELTKALKKAGTNITYEFDSVLDLEELDRVVEAASTRVGKKFMRDHAAALAKAAETAK